MTHPKQPESNGLGIASLVLGILSVTAAGVLAGIPAIITGVMALKNPASKGMGLAGIIMGALSILFAVLIVIFFMILLFIGVFAASTTDPQSSAPSYSEPPESELYQRKT